MFPLRDGFIDEKFLFFRLYRWGIPLQCGKGAYFWAQAFLTDGAPLLSKYLHSSICNPVRGSKY